MTQDKDAPMQLPSRYGMTRVQAQAFWQGPQSLTVQEEGLEEFWGWPTLSLQLQTNRPDALESRVVYANLMRSTQRMAIVRAVSWNGPQARHRLQTEGDDFQLALPARIVQIQASRLRKWLAALNSLQIPISIQLVKKDATLIRRLRIERDYKTAVVEGIWSAEDSAYESLNAQWDKLWQKMTRALEVGPQVKNVEEDWWLSKPAAIFDFDTYTPFLLASPPA